MRKLTLVTMLLLVFVITSTYSQVFSKWSSDKSTSSCEENFKSFYSELKALYEQGKIDMAASPDYLQAINSLLEKYDNNESQNLIINGDFSEGLKGWINESKYMGTSRRYEGGIDVINNQLRLTGINGGNYYIVLTQNIKISKNYNYYKISYDWMVPDKAPNYGAAYIIFDFFDESENKIGRISSLLTANSQHTLDYWRNPLPENAFLCNRKYNTTIKNWEKQEFDTRNMKGMNINKIKKISAMIAIQNDAGSGANMGVDNIVLKGF